MRNILADFGRPIGKRIPLPVKQQVVELARQHSDRATGQLAWSIIDELGLVLSLHGAG
jgi:hypothetical protein